jgi:hypothetical protein
MINKRLGGINASEQHVNISRQRRGKAEVQSAPTKKVDACVQTFGKLRTSGASLFYVRF